MTSDLVRWYVLGVQQLLDAIEKVEFVGTQSEIEQFTVVLGELRMATTQVNLRLAEEIDVPPIPTALVSAVPVLGDGIPVAPAVGNVEVSSAERFVLFRRTWRVMAAEGMCDEWGGMESQRVLREWIAAGRPMSLIHFIHESANRPVAPPT